MAACAEILKESIHGRLDFIQDKSFTNSSIEEQGLQSSVSALVKTPGQEFSVLTAHRHHMGVLFNAHIQILHWSTGDLASNEIFFFFNAAGNNNK